LSKSQVTYVIWSWSLVYSTALLKRR
jgi:hypothetical protein